MALTGTNLRTVQLNVTYPQNTLLHSKQPFASLVNTQICDARDADRTMITTDRAQNVSIIWANNNEGSKSLINIVYYIQCQCQWSLPRRSGSAAARLLGLRVRIPPGEWMYVSCECCVSDREASIVRGPWPNAGSYAIKKNIYVLNGTTKAMKHTKIMWHNAT